MDVIERIVIVVSSVALVVSGIALAHEFGWQLPTQYGIAMAHEFEWEPPTQYVDETPLDPLNDLEEYRLYCNAEQVTTFPAPATRGSYTGFEEGTSHLCSMTAVDREQDESEFSNTVVVDVAVSVPGEPILLDEGQAL